MRGLGRENSPLHLPHAWTFLSESMIYTRVGFATQSRIFARGKLLKPREWISLPVHLAIHLLKSSRQTKFPVWDLCGFPRRVRTVPEAWPLLPGLPSILPQRPSDALFIAAFCWFYSQLLTAWGHKNLDDLQVLSREKIHKSGCIIKECRWVSVHTSERKPCKAIF